jgi:hypothetical protein
MHNHDITTTTRVGHTDGGTYRLTAVGGSGDDITTVNIHKDGFGHCFLGSPDQAREQGFLFGDESLPGGLIHGTIVNHSAYPGRTYGYSHDGTNSSGTAVYRINREGTVVSTGTVESLIEGGFRFSTVPLPEVDIESLMDPEPETWQQKDARIAELETQVATLTSTTETQQQNIAILRAKLRAAETDLSEFKDAVVEAVKGAKKEHDLCLDGCNTFLRGLDLPSISKTWKGTVTRDSDNEVLLTVTGIEADTEHEARGELEDNFTVKATVTAVTFDYEYEGEGEADWEEQDHSESDWDEDDDGMAEDHKGGLSFSVEEE